MPRGPPRYVVVALAGGPIEFGTDVGGRPFREGLDVRRECIPQLAVADQLREAGDGYAILP